jgi:hypothetical protein
VITWGEIKCRGTGEGKSGIILTELDDTKYIGNATEDGMILPRSPGSASQGAWLKILLKLVYVSTSGNTQLVARMIRMVSTSVSTQ